MTMVRRGEQLSPAQARGMAAKKAKMGTVAGPLLARGLSKNMLRSRSCTPSDEEMDDMDEMDEMESATTVTESNIEHDPSSPMSARFSYAASLSPSAFPPASTSRAVMYTPLSSQEPDVAYKTQKSQDWSLSPVDEEPRKEDAMLAGLLNTIPSQISYPLRLNEIQQGSPMSLESPTSPVTSPSLATTATTAVRSSDSAYRPLAKRPPGYRSESDILENREQQARTVTGKQKGVKKPYRSQEERDKVKKVRMHGACLRCQIMRQACDVTDEGKPCQNCQVPRRKFSIPCTRAGPATRFKYLFPDLVTSRHDYRNLRAHTGDDMPGMFRLPLTHVSGFSLHVNVVEDPDIPRSELTKNFFVEQGDPQHATQQITEDVTWPLVPVISTDFRDVASWISVQIQNNKAELFGGLPWKVFPESKGQDWPRSVFFLFQQYHEKVYQSQLILKIFKTTIVRHLMSRRFYVPYDRMREVNERLSPKFQESEAALQQREEDDMCMVPTFVNKYLKAALMHLLRESLKSDFALLEEMFKLHEKSPGSEISDLDRDEALCYVAMILTIVAITQIKIMELAISRDKVASKGSPFGVQTQHVPQAKEACQLIETEVIDHILGLWSYKFVKSHRKGPLKPGQSIAAEKAQAFNLVDRFIQTKLDHEHILSSYTDLALNLDDGRVPRFLVDNPTRVLLKFIATLNPPKPRRVQTR